MTVLDDGKHYWLGVDEDEDEDEDATRYEEFCITLLRGPPGVAAGELCGGRCHRDSDPPRTPAGGTGRADPGHPMPGGVEVYLSW